MYLCIDKFTRIANNNWGPLKNDAIVSIFVFEYGTYSGIVPLYPRI